MFLLEQLYTDDTNDNDDNNNDDDNDTNDNDNDTRRTNHDCKGSLAFMPNEPKSKQEEGVANRGIPGYTRGYLEILFNLCKLPTVKGSSPILDYPNPPGKVYDSVDGLRAEWTLRTLSNMLTHQWTCTCSFFQDTL